MALVAVASGCGRFGFESQSASSDGSTGDAAASSDGVPGFDARTSVPDAPPGTVFAPTSADTCIKGIDATTHGADPESLVGRNANNGVNMWTLLQFDLPVPAGSTVSAATLRLYQTSSLGASVMGIEVYRLTQAWDEASADWSHASTGVTWPGGGAIAPTVYATIEVAPGAYGYYDWDVTALVNEWLAGTPNFGIELEYATQPPTGNFVAFATREHATAALRPQLLVTP